MFVLVTHDNEENQGCQNPGLQGCNPTRFSDLPGGSWSWRPRCFDSPALNKAFRATYLTMKSEWASCMMSFSERMCSCCLVSTMCRFFRIFMAKVLFSSLLSWTCKPGIKKGNSRLYSLGFFFFRLNQLMSPPHCGATYQLNPPKASNPQSVNDVEVGQVKVEEKGILCFVPVTPGKEGKCGNGIKDDMADKRRDNPVSTSWDITSIRTLPLCLQILLDWICGNLSRMLLSRMWRFEDVWV